MRKNVASQVIGVQMVSATDGSAFTGSVTVYVTGDAGTQSVGSVGSGACTHEGNGYHTYVPAQAETNYDLIAFTFVGTGAIPQTIQVEPRVVANVTHFGATAGTFSGGRPEVNTTLIEGIDATNQIRDAVVDDSTRIDASALNTLSSHDPGEAIMGATDLGTGSGLTSLATAASIAALNDVSEQAVHNQVHLALSDAGLVLQHTTIATLASQTSFTLTAGSPNNDAYNDCVIVVRNEAGTYNKIAVGYIADYVGLSLTVTLAANPGVFTMAVGDTVSIYPKHAATLASIAALNNLSQADVRTAVGLAAANLDTQIGDLPTNSELTAALASADDATLAAISTLSTTIGTPANSTVSADIAAVKTDTGTLTSRITSTLFSGITYLSKWLGILAGKTADSSTLTEIQATTAGAGYNNATDSLEALRDRGDAAWTTGGGGSAPTAAENATAVWTSLLAGSDFSTTGSIGKLLKDDIDAAISTRAPSNTALSTAQWTNTLATNLGTLAGHDPGSTLAAASAVSNLQTDLTTVAGYVDTEVAAIKLKTDNLPSDPADQSQVEAAISSAVSGLASQSSVNTLTGYVDTEIAAIKAKTDNLPVSPAATGDIPSAAAIASQVRTELGVELARVDVAVSTRLATSGYTAPPTSSQNASAVAAQITTDHGSGSYVRNTEPLDATATQSAAAAALVAYDPPTGAELEYVKKVVEADVVVDKTQTPWEIVWREKGTATELFRKQLKDVDGANVTSTSTVIGQAVEE